jgi:hypothetical protein
MYGGVRRFVFGGPSVIQQQQERAVSVHCLYLLPWLACSWFCAGSPSRVRERGGGGGYTTAARSSLRSFIGLRCLLVASSPFADTSFAL